MSTLKKLFKKLFVAASAAVVSFTLCAETYYVSTLGSDDNDGKSEGAGAFATLWRAVEVAVNDGDLILVEDGDYYFRNNTDENLEVDKAITIRSVSNDPTKAVVHGEYWTSATKKAQRGRRILHLNNAGATVSGLTLTGAKSNGDTYKNANGAGAYIDAGTLSNCIVSKNDVFGYSAGIHVTGGLVSSCIITDNKASAGHSTGAGIGMTGGTLENSLVYGNSLSGNGKTGSGIYVDGANCIVRGCTVVKNTSTYTTGGGIQCKNAAAQIVNCISYGNTVKDGVRLDFSGTKCNITNFCVQAETSIGVVMDGDQLAEDQDKLNAEPGFTDFDNNDFTLKDGSVCIDAAYGEPTTELDLAGNPRVTRVRMDIGCYEAPAFAGDTLTVTGDKDNLGTVLPPYGDYENVGASLTFIAPAEDQEIDATTRYRFVGWERTVVHPDGSSVKTSGEGTSVTLPHAAGDKEFFHWKISYVYAVTATVADEHAGSASGSGWYLDGANAALSATANEHYTFSAWTGDGVRYLTDEQKTAAQIEIAVTAPVALTATFAATYYVAAEGGSNDNDGLTPETAFADAWHAVSVAGEGSEIILLDGTHYFPDATTKCLTVDKRLYIHSANGPDVTTIAAQYWNGTKYVNNNWRVLYVANAQARVEGLTLKGGNQLSGDEVKSGTGGGVVLMEGGTLRNCTVTGGKVFGAAGGMYMNGGLVTGCVISNNQATAGHSNGGGVYMAGAATLEHSLVAGNSCTANGNGPYGGGIYIKDANCTVRNCTIVRNSCRYGAGLYVGARAVVTDTISYGNTATTTEDATPDFVGTCNATNVCSSVQKGVVMVNGELAPDQTMLTGDPGFTDFANGDYSLKMGSRCVDIAFGEPTVALDLAGNNRVSNEIMDLGCYELQQEGLRDVIITFEKTSDEIGSNTVSCTATGVGMTLDPAACYWTFDGRAPSAGDYDAIGTDVAVELPPGVYTVRFSTVVGGTEYVKASEPGALVIVAKTVFLKPENPNARAPYDTWEIAATNLVDAFAIAGDGTTLLYAPGTYHVYAGIDVPVACTNVATDGNPANTTIQAHSCSLLRITADALFDGFTLKGGTGFGDNGGCLYLQQGTVRNSIMTGGKATNGAGVYMSGGLLSRCVITNNTHAMGHCRGAGIYATGGTVEHSLIANNQNPGTGGYGGNAQGGGIYATSATIRNCTIVGNMTRYGAGIFGNGSTKVENSISYGNIQASTGDASDGVPNWSGLSAANAVNFCTTSASGQFGTAFESDGTPSEDQAKFIGNPGFVNLEAGDWTLALGSRCLDAAVGEPTVETDLAGNPRVSNEIMDLGCFELQQESIKGLSITVTPAGTVGTNDVDFAATGHGIDLAAGTVYWTFDGREPTADDHDATGEAFVRTLPPGVYKINAKAVIGEDEYAVTDVIPFTISSLKIFILPTNPNARYPYDTWAIAATNVESAFELATSGSVVTFGDGTHRIYKDRAINVPMTIRSLNGAAKTILDGGRREFFSQNVSAFFLLNHREATVEGLTLANGGNSKDLGISPLGITAGRLVDCVVTNCYNYELNGTVWLSSSDTSDGYAAVVSNCVIAGNMMRVKGVKGVGVYATGAGCLVANCEIRNNRGVEYVDAGNHGALALMNGATAVNCLVAGNTACATGGLYVEGAKAYNCTVVSNESTMATSTPSSGGIYANASSEVVNCLSWGNVSATITDPTDVRLNAGGSADAYRNCALPVECGAKCVVIADPCFRNAAKGNYDIFGRSPCTDAAEPMDWMAGATDLKGRPRTLGEGPDIGCYESAGVYGLKILVR